MGDWKVLDDLKYTKSDEWVKLDGSEATIGLTDYAQEQLSDLVFVELPDVGDSLEAGDEFGTVESVKASADLKMPIGGTVTAVNGDLDDEPEAVNTDAFGKGWLIKITIADASQADALMDAAAYSAHCESRA